jgi:hypothetical protein
MAAITDTPPATWGEEELAKLRADYAELRSGNSDALTKYNPTPGD